MDEPTNHLDVDMVEWLENYLNKAKITLLLVTHDRYFLDSVCDIIWEMEDRNLYVHNGSYATYLENKMIREDNLMQPLIKPTTFTERNWNGCEDSPKQELQNPKAELMLLRNRKSSQNRYQKTRSGTGF
jgi:ATP-binding cassette subfamily F protein uup